MVVVRCAVHGAARGRRVIRHYADNTYDAYVDREWGKTEKVLYDKQKHLFSRDASYLNKHEKNGEKIFWSRGNGWVMAAPRGSRNTAFGRPVAAALHCLAARDGGRSSVGAGQRWAVAAGAARCGELSAAGGFGSAFFTYALAWGISHRILDADTYLPVVERAWAGMLTHVYADGRLGAIQPIGEAPAEYKPSSSYNFGVGAFLLAGSEMDVLSERKHW